MDFKFLPRISIGSETPFGYVETDVMSFTDRRRNYILSQSIKNVTPYERFQRAKFKLKCVMYFSNIINEIRIFGTGSSLFDGMKNYKESLPKIMQNKITEKISKDKFNSKPSNRSILTPDSGFGKIWNTVLGFSILYTCTLMPWALAFEDEQSIGVWSIIELLIQTIYGIDLLLNFNLAFKDSENKLIVDHFKIISKYFKGMFVFDFIAMFPFSIALGSGYRVNLYVKLMRISRMARLFKALKLEEVLKRIADGKQATFLALNRLLIGLGLIMMLIHFVACIWNFLPRLSNFEPDTWIVRYGFIDYSTGEKYLTGVYFAVTTIMTVGFGDISAFTTPEMIMCIILELTGICFYSFVLGVITTLITSIDHKEVFLAGKASLVSLMAKDTGLDRIMEKKLTKKIRNYYEFAVLDEEERNSLLSRLTKDIRYKMSLFMYNGQVRNIHFLANQDKSFIAEYVPRLSYCIYDEREAVFSIGDYPDNMYFLMSGRAVFVFGKENMVFKTILTGAYFGEIGLEEKALRDFGVITCERSEMLLLSSEMYREIHEQYPRVFEKLTKTAKQKSLSNLIARQDIVDVVEIYKIRKERTIEEIGGSKRIEPMLGDEQLAMQFSYEDVKDNLEFQNKMYQQQLYALCQRAKKFEEKFERVCEMIFSLK